jgi:hypothetical protein
VNERYFACTDCRVYLDAGYRWCYWELERPGIVQLGDAVDTGRVLGHEPYWNPPKEKESDWLYDEVFPSVRELFDRHRGHDLRYWEDNHLPNDVHLNWLKIGHSPYPSPRHCVEVLKMTRWEDAAEWREAEGWDLGNEENRQRFRRAFEEHLDELRRRA